MAVDVVAIIAVIGGVIVSVFSQIQSSKCDWIKCGCMECTRKLDKDNDENTEILEN